MVSKEIVQIPFQDGSVPVIDIEGNPYVVLKPAFSGMGLHAQTQIEKLRNRSWARTRSERVRDAQGRPQPTIVCDVRTFLMLLATIDENLVDVQVRPKLIAYQAEVADVIEAYWTGPRKLTQSEPREYSPLWEMETRMAIREAGIFPGEAYQNSYIRQGVYDAMTANLVKKRGILDKKLYWHLNGNRIKLHQLYNALGVEENKILQGKIQAAQELGRKDYVNSLIGSIMNKAISSE